MTGPGSAVTGGRAGRGGAGLGGDWRRGWLHSYSGHNGHNNVVLIMLDATSGDYFLYFIVYFTFLLHHKLLSLFFISM